jgi:hypothetical protein
VQPWTGYQSGGFVARCSTGVVDPRSQREITTVATHGGFRVAATRPEPNGGEGGQSSLRALVEVLGSLGREGFSGWHADNHAQPPWLRYVHTHGAPLAADELRRAADLMAAQSAARVAMGHGVI